MSDELEKAALDYVEKECSYEGEHHALREVQKKTDMAHFIAGAKWQADQALKELDEARAEIERLETALLYYAETPYIFDEPDDDTDQDPSKHWRHYSGKRARQALRGEGE